MKRYITFVLFVLTILSAAAQKGQSESPAELLLAIQKSKPDTNRIRLQLKLGSHYISRSVTTRIEYKSNLDSAINLFNQALQLSIKLNETDWQYNVLDMIAEYEGDIDPERSKQILQRAVTYYHQKGNISKEAHAWESLANAYFKNNKFNDDVPQKISYFQHARSLYLQNHEPTEAAGILTDIAAHRIAIKQFDQAEKELRQSLAEYKSSGYKKLQYTFMTLVDLEYAKGNYYRTIAYCLQGIKSTAPGENIRHSSYFYWNAARSNFGVKKYQRALDWLQKAINIDRGHPDYKYFLVEILLALNRTEEAQVTLNDIAEGKFLHTSWDTLNLYRGLALYHDKKNNNDLAVQYYLKSLEMAGNVFGEGGYSWYLICYNGIAEVYLKANQAAKAEKYINNAALIFNKAKTTVDPAILVDFYTNSYKYDFATGNYRAAFKNAKTPLDRGLLVGFYDNSYKYDFATGNYRHAVKNLERRVKLQDSLFTADKEEQLAELDIQYQTAQQEQSLKLLHSQSAAQRSRLEKANLQRNITIGGILVMILVSALFYRNYKQKQAANSIITHKNELLQHLLTEKEWLLKEVHHRVKNNLQTVIGLLESQATYLQDDARKANEISKHRIYAMSLIHQQLYRGEDIRTIDVSVFLPELLDYLSESFGTERKILFNRAISPIKLGVSQAIPIALIVNEAVTNSIKYAFPAGNPGSISISMHQAADTISLVISDDGIGIDPAIIKAETTSMGLKLMKGLTGDIDGEINIINENGTTITISFSPDPLNEFNSLLKNS